MMLKSSIRRPSVMIGVALAMMLFSATPASAASSTAGRENFYRNCDAVLAVSDQTTPGSVEVYGGWGCDATSYFYPGQIILSLYLNGVEVMHSEKKTPDLSRPQSFSHAVTHPDYSTTDYFYGKMTIKGAGGVNFTLTTGKIRT
ncbi:hypothetical protein ACFYUK_47115 [Nonomuraea wenchangensis]